MSSFISTPRKELAEVTTKEPNNKQLHDIPGISTLANDGFHLTYVFSGSHNSRPASNVNLKTRTQLGDKALNLLSLTPSASKLFFMVALYLKT